MTGLGLGTTEWLARKWLLKHVGGDHEAYTRKHFAWSGQVGYYYGQNIKLNDPLGFHVIAGPPFNVVRKHNREFRILMLGGSAVEGFDTGPELNLPSELNRLLQQFNPDLEFHTLNGGVSGHLSFTENVQHWSFRNYDFDLVLVYTGYNDMYYFFMDPDYYARSEEYCHRRFSVLNQVSEHLAEKSLVFAWLRHKRVAARLLYEMVSQRRTTGWEALDASSITLFKENLSEQVRQIIERSQARSIPIIYLMQPYLTDLQRSRLLTHFEMEKKSVYLKDKNAQWEAVVDSVMPAMVETVSGLCQQQGVPFIYFKDVISKYTDMFYDDVHLHGTGMSLAALELAKIVQQKVLKRSIEGWPIYGRTSAL